VSLLLLLAASAAGLCPLPEPAPARDAASARAYLEVGDAEAKSGSTETALLAYREALRLDPSNVRAREAHDAACARRTPAAMLGEGIRRMEAGDREGAIAVFQWLRTGRADPAAALYEGILRYEMGDDDEARRLFVEAQSGPAYAARAQYFLGLIELRDGSASDATVLFDQVAASSTGGTLGERAEVLRSAAMRSGRGVIGIDLESGYDSNVNFTPSGGPGSADGAAAAGGWLLVRPLGLSGPYLRGNAFYRSQMEARDRDLGLFGGQAGWRLGRGETYGFADYGYEATLLGGAPYLRAHRGRVGARWQIRRVALSSVYTVRFGNYETPASTEYTGVLHTLDPEVSLRFPEGSSLSLGYHGGRDTTAFAHTSAWEHGPRAAVRLLVLPTLRVGADASFIARTYDAAPASGVNARSDQIFYAGSTLEKDFDRFTVRLQAGYRISSSNDPAYSYSRLIATLGASYILGVF